MIIQFRIVERDLATLIGLNDYETLRLIEVLRRSRTFLLYQGQLNPLTAGELCQHHSPWRPFWPDDYPQVFGESIGQFDGELHLYTSNNVIPHKRALREIPLCVLKNNFFAEVKDLQQQGTLEKVTEPTEWVSAPTDVNCKRSAKNGIRLCIGSRPLNIALKRYEYPNSAVDHLLTEIGNAN